nr:hypothetical protein [Verrucomicrobium sp. BvORR034]
METSVRFLPVESVIRDRQSDYYRALALADKQGQSTRFIEFLLSAVLAAQHEAASTDQATDQVKALLKCLGSAALTTLECMAKLGLSHRPTFRQNYLQPALDAGLIERTLPDRPNSPLQRYRQTRQRS